MCRDRAVDESGNQLAVFGRRAARPLNGEEQRRLYIRDGQLYTVTNDPPQPASRQTMLQLTKQEITRAIRLIKR
jgi:hypothetical protein